MNRFWTMKAIRIVVTLFMVVTFTFLVLRLTGDPVVAMLGPDATVNEIEQFREEWGLNKSLFEQYVTYVGSVATGNFGTSLADGRPVITVILERVPATLLLGGTAFVISLTLGVLLGIAAALNRGTWIDQAVIAFASLGFALPSFFFGILLILLFSLKLQWLPSAGSSSWQHLIMPAATLALSSAGSIARFSRSSMLEVLEKLYLQAAAAKGVPGWRRLFVHAVPNAAIPVVTVVGMRLGDLVAGAVVVELVFAWPGVGRMLVQAVAVRDLALVQGIVLFVATTMILANLIVDLLYGVLDPRIRVGEKS